MTHLSVPSFWRLNKAKYRLIASRCEACGKVAFPPRVVCIGCGSTKLTETVLPDSGQILSWTTIHVPPEGYEAPYTIALVRLGDAVVSGQIVGDLEKLTNNSDVCIVFRKYGENKNGLLLYGFKFVLKTN